MAFFHRYHRRQLTFPSKFPISLSPTSVTTHLDQCYHLKYIPKTSYFHHFAGGRVAAVHEEASPNENTKWTTIHHRSLVPRGRLARGGCPSNAPIYTPHPKTAPDQGMLNRYFLSQDTSRSWREHAWPSYLWLGVWSVVYWRRTLNHGDITTQRKMTNYVTILTSSTHAAPPPNTDM